MAAVAWVDSSRGAPRVLVSISHDTGLTWTAATVVDADFSGADKLLVADAVEVMDEEIRILWLDERNGAGSHDLYFRASRDGGLTWAPELRLDTGGAPGSADVNFFRSRSSTSGAAIAVAAIVSGLPGGDEVRMLRSVDGGASFGASTLLHAGGVVARLDLDRHDAELHLVWMDDSAVAGFNSAYYQHSFDDGLSWLAAAPMISDTVNTHPSELRIAADAARVCVVFQDLFVIHAVGYNLSLDNGATWLPAAKRLAGSRSPTTTPAEPQIFLGPLDVLVCWSDDRSTPGFLTPWLAGTRNGGASWQEVQLDAGFGVAPRIQGDEADGSFAVQWNGGAQARSSGSRAANPHTLPAFTVAGGATGSSALLDVSHRYDSAYAHHLAFWLDQDGAGHRQVWVGGYRIPNVMMLGSGQAGTPITFRALQFREADAGREFRVLLSGDQGSAPLPFHDGRSTGLAADAWLSFSTRSMALRGALAADGSGLTTSVSIPTSLSPGTRVWFNAVVFDAAARAFGDLADARSLVVQ